MGIDYLAKNVAYKGHIYRLQLWDTAGQEKFKSLVPAYLKDAHCAIMVYDISARNTFEQLEDWMKIFNDYKRADAVSIVAGNKYDLRDGRKVNYQEQQWA